jgi:hypothetical protein
MSPCTRRIESWDDHSVVATRRESEVQRVVEALSKEDSRRTPSPPDFR